MNTNFDIQRKIRYRLLAELHRTIAEMYSDSTYYGAMGEIKNCGVAYEKCFGAFYAFYSASQKKNLDDGSPVDEFGVGVDIHGE